MNPRPLPSRRRVQARDGLEFGLALRSWYGPDAFDSIPQAAGLTPLFVWFYLLISLVLFVNLLIALFNQKYVEVTSRAKENMRFLSFRDVNTYITLFAIPPPFNFPAHLIDWSIAAFYWLQTRLSFAYPLKQEQWKYYLEWWTRRYSWPVVLSHFPEDEHFKDRSQKVEAQIKRACMYERRRTGMDSQTEQQRDFERLRDLIHKQFDELKEAMHEDRGPSSKSEQAHSAADPSKMAPPVPVVNSRQPSEDWQPVRQEDHSGGTSAARKEAPAMRSPPQPHVPSSSPSRPRLPRVAARTPPRARAPCAANRGPSSRTPPRTLHELGAPILAPAKAQTGAASVSYFL